MSDRMYCADRGDGTYLNPIIFGGFGDCSVLKDGKDYYMIHGGSGPRAALLFHSRDLVNWNPLYFTLEGYTGGAWAPELVKVGDTYYIYNFFPTTNPHWNFGDVWVMTTKDIKNGPWTRPEIIKKDVPVIDPGHVVGEDGKRYLFMSTNQMMPLSDDGLSVTGELRRAYPDWPIPDDWDIEGLCTESPKFTQRNGYYYLTLAEGGTAGPPTSHCAVSLRAKSIFGPWESSPHNPIAHTYSREETWWSKGHGTLVEGPDGEQWYMMYQAFLNGHRNTTGKATVMEPIEWTDDGWFRILPGSQTDKPIAMPQGGQKVENTLRLSDDFSSGRFGLQWYFTDYETEKTRCRFTGKGLELTGMGGSLHDTEPVLCKREHVSLEACVELTADWYAGAGVTFYMSPQLSCGIAIEQGLLKVYYSGGRWMRNRENIVPYEGADWDGTHIFLKLKNNAGVVSPWYSADGKNWKKINICFETGSWTGRTLRPGLFCYGGGKAVFHRFDYDGKDD